MTVVTSYPGVYLSEEPLLNLSVSGYSTAVPVFVYEIFGEDDTLDYGIHCYHSWAEFIAAHPTPKFNRNYYLSAYAWFMSGGGKCYQVHVNVISYIQQYDDITLLVTAGVSRFNKEIFERLSTLINNGQKIFGLFEIDDKNITLKDDVNKVMETFPSTPHVAAFYPWCFLEDKLIPPSVIAAISLAKTDSARGVWKSPANVVINGFIPKYLVSDELQGRFTQGKALNMIRNFPDLGTVVWGARTLDDSDNWRYISVRRLFDMVEKDIQKALNKMIFEPNSQPTWQKCRSAVENYLYRLWQQGALLGNKAEEAYFVKIGKDITMTEEDIKQGKMHIDIGLAAVRPAEFILLQFSQTISQ